MLMCVVKGIKVQPPEDEIYSQCDCTIALNDDNSTVRSNGPIKGKIIFNLHPIKGLFHDLCIELRGIAYAFHNKSDCRTETFSESQQFLPENEDEEDYESKTLRGFYFIKNGSPTSPQYEQSDTQTKYIWPFTLVIDKLEDFPPTFLSPFGSIEYKLFVYGTFPTKSDKQYYMQDQVLTQNIKGRLNLTAKIALAPNLDQPLTVSREKSRFFFSRRGRVKAALSLGKQGFVIGEILRFRLDIENRCCENITQLSVYFVQKISYFLNYMTRRTSIILKQKKLECATNQGELSWNSEFILPKNLIPTFTRKKKAVEILYYIHFTVDWDGKPGMKGEVPILIGTTRTSTGETGPTRETTGNNTDSNVTSMSPSGPTESRDWDTTSIASCATLPPNYSALSSRRPSLETLPPTYEEYDSKNQSLLGVDSGKSRPRSNPTVM